MIVCLLVGKKCPATNVPLGQSQSPSSHPWAQSLPSRSPVRVDLWAGVVCHVWVAQGPQGSLWQSPHSQEHSEDLGSFLAAAWEVGAWPGKILIKPQRLM